MSRIAPTAATISCASHPAGGTTFRARSMALRTSAPTMPRTTLATMPILASMTRSAIHPAIPPMKIEPTKPTPFIREPSANDDAGDDQDDDRADDGDDHLLQKGVAEVKPKLGLLGDEAAHHRPDEAGNQPAEKAAATADDYARQETGDQANDNPGHYRLRLPVHRALARVLARLASS